MWTKNSTYMYVVRTSANRMNDHGVLLHTFPKFIGKLLESGNSVGGVTRPVANGGHSGEVLPNFFPETMCFEHIMKTKMFHL